MGQNIRDHLAAAGVGTMEAGLALGIGQVSVQRHLRGDTEPSLDQLDVYARLCGVGIADLLPRLDSNQEPTGSRSAA